MFKPRGVSICCYFVLEAYKCWWVGKECILKRQLNDQDMRNESCILHYHYTQYKKHTLHTAHCIQYIKHIGVVITYIEALCWDWWYAGGKQTTKSCIE